MRIQHNIMAMNSYRNYTSNTSALAKNLEKLSSGYRINRAGDDAAGLAISEKMRAQISGLKQAQSNAKSGINLVQTAEGALTEVHDMLNRMVTLADQSANGTYDNDVDRANLQKEVDALQTEIDRIAKASNFNGINLLDGSLEDGATLGGEAVELNATVTTRDVAAAAVRPEFTISLDGYTGTHTGATKAAIDITIGDETLTVTTAANGTNGSAVTWNGATVQGSAGNAGKATINGLTYTVTNNNGTLTFTADADPTSTAQANADMAISIAAKTDFAADATASYNPSTQVIKSGAEAVVTKQATVAFDLTEDMVGDGASINIGGTTYKVDYSATGVNGTTIGVKDLLNDKGELKGDDALDEVANRLTKAAGSNAMFTVGSNGKKVTLQSKVSDDTDLSTKAKVLDQVSVNKATKTSGGLTLQIGDTSDEFNQLTVSIRSMKTASLGIDTVDISSQKSAADAVDVIKKAINTVSSVRGDLGATQNRLEHTINNLSVMTENIQDAEATIRDVDVAEEMMAYTKNNILVQSAQAMLAQANQVPQGVLQLLQ